MVTSQFVMVIPCALRAQIEDRTGSRYDLVEVIGASLSEPHTSVIGASLSEPHTSVIALRVACVCVFVCLRVAIYRKFKLNERIQRYTRYFKFAHVLAQNILSAS